MDVHKDLWQMDAEFAKTITEEDVGRLLSTMKADPRVSFIDFAGWNESGIPMVRVKAVDRAEIDLDGAYSLEYVMCALHQIGFLHEMRVASAKNFVDSARAADERDAQDWAERIRLSDERDAQDWAERIRLADERDAQDWAERARLADQRNETI